MAESRFKRIGASMLSSLLLQARNLVISLVVFRLFADPTTLWGTVSHVTAVVTLLSLPAKFGLEMTAVQMVSSYRDDAPAAAVDALRRASVLRIVLALSFGLPMLLVPGAVGALFDLQDVPHLVQLGGWLLVTTSLYEYASYLLSGVDDFVGMAVTRLVYAVVNIGAIGWIAWAGFTDAAAPILWSQVAGGAAAAVVATALLVPRIRQLARAEPSPSDAPPPPTGHAMTRAIVAFSVPVTLVSAAGQVFSYLDRVMIPMLSDRAQLGSYAVASSVVAAALFGTYAFRNVARAQLPGLLRRDPPAARHTLLSSYRACVAVGMWIAAGTLACAQDLLVSVYGADAAEAASMLVWFVPYVLLSAHSNLSATALIAAGRPRTYALLTGALTVLTFALNLVFIPRWGGFGAIAASTLSLVPLSVLSYREVCGVYGPDLWSWRVVGSSGPTLIRQLAIAGAACAAGSMLSGPWLAQGLLAGVVVTAVFGVAMWATGELDAVRSAM